MLRKFTFLMNAAMFASAGTLAAHAVAPREVAAIAQKVITPSLIARLSPAPSPGALASANPTGPIKVAAPLPFAQSGALAPAAAPGSTGNAIVPPIVRRRPSSGPAVAGAETVPVARPAATRTARVDRSTDITTRAVKTAAITPGPAASANKKPIDLTGRSALGAPKGIATLKNSPKTGKCNTGLKYDAKLSKCVAAPKAATQPKPVKVVKAAPAPTIAPGN